MAPRVGIGDRTQMRLSSRSARREGHIHLLLSPCCILSFEALFSRRPSNDGYLHWNVAPAMDSRVAISAIRPRPAEVHIATFITQTVRMQSHPQTVSCPGGLDRHQCRPCQTSVGKLDAYPRANRWRPR